MSRRPSHLPPRAHFSKATKTAIAERSQGQCEVHRIPRFYGLALSCQNKATEFDHIIPDGERGPSTLENAAHLCSACHRLKTVQDTRRMAKADRQSGRSGQYARRKRSGPKLKNKSNWGKPKLSPLSKHHPNYRKRKWI